MGVLPDVATAALMESETADWLVFDMVPVMESKWAERMEKLLALKLVDGLADMMVFSMADEMVGSMEEMKVEGKADVKELEMDGLWVASKGSEMGAWTVCALVDWLDDFLVASLVGQLDASKVEQTVVYSDS